MIKTALTAALIIGSVSLASATEFDPNLQNRYPQASATQVFEGRNVGLTTRNVALPQQTQTFGGTQATGFDRASNPYAGGGF